MRVWIINHYAIPPSLGGLVRHYYFSKYLTEKGHKVKIFTSSKIHNSDVNLITDKSLYLEKEQDGVEYTFVKNSDYEGNGFDRIINMLQFPFNIWRVCKQFEKPDVIYTSSPDLLTAVFAVIMAKAWKIKKVVEIRDLWPESIVEYNNISKKNIVIKLLYKIEKWVYKNADELIFTSAGGAEYIKEKGWEKKVSLNKLHHVNNGVDLAEFDYNQDNYRIVDEDLENNQIFKVVYTGSIRKVNNLDKLLQCAQILKEKESNIKFLIWGDGNERVELEKKCKELRLDNIVFKGKVEKKYIPYVLSKADVNLMHWRFTPLMRFGMSANKQFDYLAAGKPILSDINSAYNLVSEYGCGIVVKNDSVEMICNGLTELENCTREVLDAYGRNAREVAKKYEYKELSNKIEEILQEAINK